MSAFASHFAFELKAGIRNKNLLLPSTYGMNAFRGLAIGGTADFTPWGAILTLFIGGVTAFFRAWFLFRWDNQNAGRRGHPALALLTLAPYMAWLFVV